MQYNYLFFFSPSHMLGFVYQNFFFGVFSSAILGFGDSPTYVSFLLDFVWLFKTQISLKKKLHKTLKPNKVNTYILEICKRMFHGVCFLLTIFFLLIGLNELKVNLNYEGFRLSSVASYKIRGGRVSKIFVLAMLEYLAHK
ncbi:hypothetical protein IEQ34_004274 [Dendrobium chrysotoxum]|uniref:Uncharacterized protein n=1 Tax=Dendrobium chrysotoxum TaxID=161865 RepID=A0AAV7HDL2_DENCH|nr:hypothetical protein IEQ34_004274 [Dendrobium chrysotoxum]